MNFKEDPSNYFLREHKKFSKRYEKGVFKELSNTCTYTSIVTLGMWRLFGDHIPFKESLRIFEKSIQNGCNHFDLGNNYGRPPGSAEKLFGKALKKYKQLRDEFIISSKAGFEMMPGPNGSGSSLKYLRSQIEGSLKRINIDYLDIFYTHRYDPQCELVVVADNLKYLHEMGLYLYAGISSYPKDKLFKIIELLNERKVPIACLQYNISLLSLDNFLICKECFERWGISTIAFSPLNQGILTNNYFHNTKPRNSRAKESNTTIHPKNIMIEERLSYINKISKKHYLSIEDLAFCFLFSNQFISSVAYGPRNLSQVLNMNDCLKNVEKIKHQFTQSELIENSISTLDQWKEKDLRSIYKIIE